MLKYSASYKTSNFNIVWCMVTGVDNRLFDAYNNHEVSNDGVRIGGTDVWGESIHQSWWDGSVEHVDEVNRTMGTIIFLDLVFNIISLFYSGVKYSFILCLLGENY